ncbi:aminotransferase class I/II-fold pyridoxal phosphate-dependent enzyme [Crossiella sp. CA198]|uniref:aminotransferase class I/II-fold pyridoxal phosphate-dependent enzyme n=1 Tax=Crossiella sp. CA198 TaxID=3455607 RepID=UPI003F8D40FB
MSDTAEPHVPPGIAGTTAGEISGSVRDLVDAGRLRPGDVLPPIRDLAEGLGVHRNTVAVSYRLLVAAGVAETRGRHGTLIRALPALEAEGGTAPAGQVDLASGNPDPRLLPDLMAAVATMSYSAPLYGVSTTDPALEAWARDTMGADLPHSSFGVTVTNGSVDAVERLLTARLTRGDAVAIEDPCFLASVGTLRINGFRPLPVAVDTEGPTPDGLRRALQDGARAVVLTPRAHNPTGMSRTAARTAEVRAVLAGYPHALIIEDDHFSAISHQPYHRLITEHTSQWALVRSVSKFLGPDLRLAIVASDLDSAAQLNARLRPGTTWVSHLLQRLTATLLTDPRVASRLRQARRAYPQRSATLAESLADNGITVHPPADGVNLWIPLEAESSAVIKRLADQGWTVRDGAQFAATPTSSHNAIRVTTATITPAQARRFAAALAHILREQ